MALINKDNLNKKTLTNSEVLALLQKLSLTLDPCGFSRTLDVIEELTGDRNFTDCCGDEKAIKSGNNSLALKIKKASV